MGNAVAVESVIAMLGGPAGEPVLDFLADPGAACRALDAAPEHGGVVTRVAPEMGAAAAGYGPAPAAPLWIRVMRGAREVGTATLQGGEGMVRRAARVEIDDREERCCDAPGCDKTRAFTSAWLVLDPVPEPGAPQRLLVAEQRVQGSAEPVAAHAVAARLAAALGIPLQRGGADLEIDAEPPAPLGASLAAPALARFALRSEGDRVVLRDWESAGPRASAARNAWIGAAFLVLAAGGWYQLWRAIEARGPGGSPGEAIASGVVAVLLTLAGVAFLGVARFSAQYRAASAPLLAIGRDRVIVLPWVSRDGAVDARPEGRLGAAIPLGEVRHASPAPRGSGVAVELDTDHGRIDAMVCPSAAAAELWSAVIDRVLDEARHPKQGASARQRARQRAATA